MKKNTTSLTEKVRRARAKLGKSEAQELKEQMERNQIAPDAANHAVAGRAITDVATEMGIPMPDPDDAVITAPGQEPVTTSAKKLAKLAADVKKARRILNPKQEQTDMVTSGKLEVPEPTSPLYLAGKRVREACEQEALNKDEKAEAIQELQAAMRKAKRYIYKVDGYAYELQHFGAQDKIKIIKPK